MRPSRTPIYTLDEAKKEAAAGRSIYLVLNTSTGLTEEVTPQQLAGWLSRDGAYDIPIQAKAGRLFRDT